jgi:hypothetical protein
VYSGSEAISQIPCSSRHHQNDCNKRGAVGLYVSSLFVLWRCRPWRWPEVKSATRHSKTDHLPAAGGGAGAGFSIQSGTMQARRPLWAARSEAKRVSARANAAKGQKSALQPPAILSVLDVGGPGSRRNVKSGLAYGLEVRTTGLGARNRTVFPGWPERTASRSLGLYAPRGSSVAAPRARGGQGLPPMFGEGSERLFSTVKNSSGGSLADGAGMLDRRWSNNFCKKRTPAGLGLRIVRHLPSSVIITRRAGTAANGIEAGGPIRGTSQRM